MKVRLIAAAWAHPRFGRSLRFLAMTAVSLSVTLGVTAGLREGFGVGDGPAGGVALMAAFCVNFLTMRGVVFAAAGPVAGHLARFAATSAAFRLAEYLAYLALVETVRVPYLIAMVGTLGTSFVLKYVTYRAWVFRG